MAERTMTVSELNGLVKQILESDELLRRVAVTGEISNFKRNSSGHCYFTLKDDRCAVSCTLFRSQADRLRFRPEQGMKVIVMGRVTLYPAGGVYQIIVDSLMPEGIGDLHAAFEQLKQKLGEEGLFDADRKKPLPRFPKTIAVITSGTGAAVMDISRILRRRWPLSKVVVLPVAVQGTEAPAQIAGALRYVNRWDLADVIICGRGGGSLEDLWGFNSEKVARAISESRIPVISAVGHEPDVTIADYAADRRAATPSNGAEIAVPDREEMLQQLDDLSQKLLLKLEKRISSAETALHRMKASPVLADPLRSVELRQQRLDAQQVLLTAAGERVLLRQERRISEAAASLEALSPLKVLARGYAVVRDPEGKALTSVNQTSEKEKISVTLSDGEMSCRVEKITERSPGRGTDDV